MWAATRLRISPIKFMVSISLCFAFISAADQLSDPGNVHSKPQLVLPNSTLPEDTPKSHNVPKQHQAAYGNIDKEERGMEGVRNVLNRFHGKKTSRVTDPLFQTDAKIGDKKLVQQLQAMTARNEAQESQLVATINKFRTSKDPADQRFGDSEFIKLLNNPKSAEAVYENWLKKDLSPLDATKLLDRSFDRSSPKSLNRFFRHDSASPWLSYVGYYWQSNRRKFIDDDLFELFQRAQLENEAPARLLYNARKTPFGQNVLYRMQQSKSQHVKPLEINLARIAREDKQAQTSRTHGATSAFRKYFAGRSA